MVTEGTFTCIGKGHGAPALPASRREWEAMRSQTWLADLCRRIESCTDDERVRQWKSTMPVWTPRCAEFRDNHRAERDAIRRLARQMLDIDEKGHTDRIVAMMHEGRIAGYKVLLIEESVRRGTHILVESTDDERLVQQRIAEAIGLRVDPAVRNVAGCIYMVSDDHTRYLADDFYNAIEMDGALADTSLLPLAAADEPAGDGQGTSATMTYNGLTYGEIIDKYWELFNDGKRPHEGDRNVKTYELAMTLRSICEFSQQRLEQVIPRYDGFAECEWRKTIENALKEPHRGMPFRLRQVLAALKSSGGVKACGGTLTTPPPMPRRLPPLVRLLTSNVPDYYKPAVSSAIFPALATHLHGVKFRYWDNVEHEATFMNVLIGRQSIGKGSIKKPVEFIMEDIRRRDLPNRQREAEWKQKNPSARQKKDPRPTDICIQMLIDNLTDAVFNQRIVDAHHNGERYIYTLVDEIEALKKVTSKGSADEVGLLIRKAFDNSLAGQERVGADSVSGIAPLRWNWNASTTPPNARRFFQKMVNDGTVSRLDISTILLADDVDTDPVIGIYDEAFATALKPYIERLENANGLILCPQANRLSLQMKQANRESARLYESEAYKVFSYRANVIAWLKGMVLYVAHGYKWDKTIADFVQWTEHYNLWCKMLYFGQQLEQELHEEMEIQRRPGLQNLLELLPDEFSKQQYRQMRTSQGRPGDGESTLRTWACRKYIALDEVTGLYRKTIEYKKKFSHA